MKINKINSFNKFGRFGDNDDTDVSTFGRFLNSVISHHGPQWPGQGNDPGHGPNTPGGSHTPPNGHHSPPHSTPDPITQMQFRSADGSGNNLTDPDANQTGTSMIRIPGGTAHFDGDGHTPLHDDINPRTVSNVVVGQGDAAVPNAEGLSGMMYAWGQFIDHDLDLIKSANTEPFDITIPVSAEDPNGGTISMFRSAMAAGTGTDAAHPATAVNTITGWLDASMIYGSDAATAMSLRVGPNDGHLKTSAGDNLPIVQMPNPDPNGPPMIDAFMAGDVRAQENPSLTALQTIFVREHNYQVDRLAELHPTWTGEQLYQMARAIVGAEIAHITYDEFLPHLLGTSAITPYQGYDPTVDPTITEEFAGAAFRFGHSIVSEETVKIAENGGDMGEEQLLKDVFFESPEAFMADGGAGGQLRHLGADLSQAMDARIVDSLRNFLSDPPDVMDLAAINIQRGRDLGLGTLNETRIALGLTPYDDIGEITDDAGTVQALRDAFGNDPDKIDLWTGGLAEKHVNGGMIGETFAAIIGDQFEALRDGDRLWYENAGFDSKTLAMIKDTSLSDIIMRNTDTDHMQDDAFVYYSRHSGLKGGVETENPDSPQLVIGSKGFDTLIGGPQGDMLVAATGGTQTMTGGDGADQFIVNHNMNVKITDFKPGTDKIVFDDAGALNFKDVHIKADHGNAVIDANSNHIVLIGVSPIQLHQNDFIYHN